VGWGWGERTVGCALGVWGDIVGFEGWGYVGVFNPMGLEGDVFEVEDQACFPGVEAPAGAVAFGRDVEEGDFFCGGGHFAYCLR